MHVQERQAWLTLVAATAALTLFCVLVALVGLGSRSVAPAAFGLLGLVGAARRIGTRERKAGKVVMDERDHEIERMATLLAYNVFWALFVGAAIGPFFLLGPGTIMRVPTYALTFTPLVAVCVFFLVNSLATIVLYRRGSHGREA